MKDVRYTSGNRAELDERIRNASDYEMITHGDGRVTFTGSDYVEHFEYDEFENHDPSMDKHPRFWECYS